MPATLLEILQRSQALGFLGPGRVAEHIELAQAFLPPLAHAQVVLDLGSGGGVPGLILAQERPDAQWVLLDASQKRTSFLRRACVDLGWSDRVRVVRQRAEDAGRGPLRGGFDAVVARSFGSPAVTAECAAPLLRKDGVLVVSEPPVASAGRWPREPLAELGLEVEGANEVAVLRQRRAAPPAVPRTAKAMQRAPLW